MREARGLAIPSANKQWLFGAIVRLRTHNCYDGYQSNLSVRLHF
jgi:hypothetical protein